MWQIDHTKILSRGEITKVLVRAKGQNRIIFRLACTGLRVSEICDLAATHVHVGQDHPYIQIVNGKGGRNRRVPLWWDADAYRELADWRSAMPESRWHFVATKHGTRLERWAVRKRFLSACRCLGQDRQRTLTIHHGRHTFISYALQAGRPLAAVRDAAGHASLHTTSIYAHLTEDSGEMGSMY